MGHAQATKQNGCKKDKWGRLSVPLAGWKMLLRTQAMDMDSSFWAQIYTILLNIPLSVSIFVRIFVKNITN